MAVMKIKKDGVWHDYGAEKPDPIGDLSRAVAIYRAGENAKLYILPVGERAYRAALVGAGATDDYSRSQVHPWDIHGAEILDIYVAEGITAIGDSFFSRLSRAVKFVNLSSVLTTIGAYAFNRCFKLADVSGFGRVATIGERAFLGCVALKSIDIDSTVCTSIGAATAHISSLEDAVATGTWGDSTTFGAISNRRLKWGDTLADIKAEKYTATKRLKCLNADQQGNYPDIPFCSGISRKKHVFAYVAGGGCVGLSLYHAYNTIHATDGKAANGFEDFWYNVLKADSVEPVQKYVNQGLIDDALIYDSTTESGHVDGVTVNASGDICFSLRNFHGGTDPHEIMGEMLRRLGWTVKEEHQTYGVEQKHKIYEALARGIPVLASVNHYGLNESHDEGEHEVCIIGCNRESDKLTVVDSLGAAGKAGHVYTIGYEDLFYAYEETPGGLRNKITLLDIGG